MKLAQVYGRGGALLLNSYSETTEGFCIAYEPFLRLEAGSTPASIGEAAIRVLEASGGPVPHPTDWGDVFRPMLKLAGVGSWRAFVKGTTSLMLEIEGDKLKLIPQRNLGPKRGFKQISEKTVELPFPSPPEEIGAAVTEAMAACVPWPAP